MIIVPVHSFCCFCSVPASGEPHQAAHEGDGHLAVIGVPPKAAAVLLEVTQQLGIPGPHLRPAAPLHGGACSARKEQQPTACQLPSQPKVLCCIALQKKGMSRRQGKSHLLDKSLHFSRCKAWLDWDCCYKMEAKLPQTHYSSIKQMPDCRTLPGLTSNVAAEAPQNGAHATPCVLWQLRQVSMLQG